MPNIIDNEIRFPTAGAFRAFCETYGSGVDTSKADARFSFNWILPQPQTESECEEKYRIRDGENARLQRDKNRPWFDWYEWNCDHWGTKWDAYGFPGWSFFDEVNSSVKFLTAWSPPFKVYERMAELKIDFDFSWSEEDGSGGRGRVLGGKLEIAGERRS